MFSINKIVFVAFIASAFICIEGGVLAPAIPAPAPAISYHHAIPYNVPPYSDRTDIFNKYVSVHAVHAAPAPVPVAVPAIPAVPAVPHTHAYPVPHAHAYPVPHTHAYPAPHAHAVPAYGPAPFAYGHPAAVPAAIPAGYPAEYSAYDYGSVVPAHSLPAPFLRR